MLYVNLHCSTWSVSTGITSNLASEFISLNPDVLHFVMSFSASPGNSFRQHFLTSFLRAVLGQQCEPEILRAEKINKMYHHTTRDSIQNLFSNPDLRKGHHVPNDVCFKTGNVPLMLIFRLLCKFIVRTGASPRTPPHEWGHHKLTNTRQLQAEEIRMHTKYITRILKACSRSKPRLKLRPRQQSG